MSVTVPNMVPAGYRGAIGLFFLVAAFTALWFGLIVVLIMLLLPNGFAGFLRRFEPRVKTAIKSDPKTS